jgi:multidrug efflux pump subunit AcrA (membrane-fusion protein)
VIQRGGLSSLICAALLACAPQATLEAGERGEHRAHDEHAEGEHADEPAHGAMPRRVRLTAQVIADAGILDVPVTREPLAETFLVVGELAADPDRTAQLAARVAGTIAALEFREGDAVKEGQVLATIRAPSLGSLRSDLASLQARATSARSNLVRLEALAGPQHGLAAGARGGPRRGGRARRRGARGRSAAHGPRHRPDRRRRLFTLRASLSGVVTQRGVVVGQAVTPRRRSPRSSTSTRCGSSPASSSTTSSRSTSAPPRRSS